MKFQIKKLSETDFQLAKDLFISFQKDDGVELSTSASNDYLTKLLGRGDFHVIVAVNNNKIIGGLTAYELRKYKREETEMFIYELGVDGEFRRKGIATALIDFLKKICKEKGINEMFVGALAGNTAAVNLYEKTGGDAEKVFEFTYDLD